MKKFQFIKETKLNGDVFYYTTIDGQYISASLSLKKEEGLALYQRLVDAKGDNTRIEVLLLENV